MTNIILTVLVAVGMNTAPVAVSAPAPEPVKIPFQNEDSEILWLARGVFSETKRKDEMKLIAWVIRNRMESNFGGANSYKEVVLAPKQFSGFNSNDPQYRLNISLDYSDIETANVAWRNAVEVAEEVYNASDHARPFGHDVKHFYSPNAIKHTPSWAEGKFPAKTVYDYEKNYTRFAFYAGVK